MTYKLIEARVNIINVALPIETHNEINAKFNDLFWVHNVPTVNSIFEKTMESAYHIIGIPHTQNVYFDIENVEKRLIASYPAGHVIDYYSKNEKVDSDLFIRSLTNHIDDYILSLANSFQHSPDSLTNLETFDVSDKLAN